MLHRQIPWHTNLRRVALKHGNPQEGKFCREVSSNIKSAIDEDKVPEGVAAIVSL
jgi:hypothetical protein